MRSTWRHSAKDLPAEEDEGFTIAAVPDAGGSSDVLIRRKRRAPRRALIGTSSVRRRAQLLAAFPGLEVDLRGNVETRLRKLEEGEVDAAVLAAARPRDWARPPACSARCRSR